MFFNAIIFLIDPDVETPSSISNLVNPEDPSAINLSRQIEVDQNGNTMLFSANRGLPVAATLHGTGLADSSKRKFEIM